MSWTEIMTSKTLFQNAFILRKPGVTEFPDIIKISIFLSKQPLKSRKKLKELAILH